MVVEQRGVGTGVVEFAGAEEIVEGGAGEVVEGMCIDLGGNGRQPQCLSRDSDEEWRGGYDCYLRDSGT